MAAGAKEINNFLTPFKASFLSPVDYRTIAVSLFLIYYSIKVIFNYFNMHMFYYKKVIAFVILLTIGVAFAAYASHSWGGYHWARTANSFNLKLGDNVSSVWDQYLSLASSDWSASNVLDTNLTAGATNPKTCKAVKGRVEVCNSKYGNNGWLGVASIWISGSHIVQGAVKMNDTYFNTTKYNTPAWRRFVMCQEIGHTLGLDHQDEIFSNLNLGTCMDYTNDPDGFIYNQLGNLRPNQHDYDTLSSIYGHLDTTTTVAQPTSSSFPDINHSDPGVWGREIHKDGDGRSSLYELDLGKGKKIFTFVFWAR